MITNIEKLFNVDYGQKEFENKSLLQGEEGENIIISSKGEDNGVYGFFNVKNRYTAPFITVPRTGTIGQAFVQLKDCSVDNNCLVLIPKQYIDTETLFQIAFQIRLNKWKYKYGRQITPKRLEEQKIRLENIKVSFKEISNKLMPKEIKKERIPNSKNIKLIKLTDLCNIERKNGLPLNVISLEGNIPYISSSSKDNGVVAFTEEEPNAKAKSLTVAKDGNDGFSFFQPYDFITSIHNYVLTPKNNYPAFILFYIGAVIKKRAYCYNHYYPLSKKHLEKIEIPIPYKDGEIDLDYIRKIVKNSYGFDEISKFL